jgi:phenylalanyl-tRNA synthetase alpha chain
MEQIQTIKAAALAEIEAADGADALDAVRVKYISRKGLIPDLMKHLKSIPPEQKKAYGQQVNDLKDTFQAAWDARKQSVDTVAEQPVQAFDVTLPGQWRGSGSKHPITQLTERAIQIFQTMGFTVADGPDIETVFNNFDALNHPPGHPARDVKDTFYLDDPNLLLRTHTSPVQVRYMLSHPPPIRIIAPGRCYRRDTPDATHSANFHQIEGLYVGRDVSLAKLKGDLSHFAREAMGPETRIRFRPHFFPFTEPSVEVDFSCHVCGGDGCRVCKQSGWIEIAGAGMVDPNVFKAVGYDPDEVTGYAFGMGIERIAMILFGITDIRHLYENDVRYLAQF